MNLKYLEIKRRKKMINKTNAVILLDKIRQWSDERKLYRLDPKAQMCKLVEEVGELANGLNKNKSDVIKDSIGDIIVVLVVMCTQLDLDITECINLAYETINKRKGKIINGIFVKEEDLKEND